MEKVWEHIDQMAAMPYNWSFDDLARAILELRARVEQLETKLKQITKPSNSTSSASF